MTPYEILKAHIAKHKYARGRNKGSAPLDPKRRRRDWELIVDRGDCVVLHRYSTDVLSFYPDGRVVVSCSGWEHSPTTRVAMTKGFYLAGIRLSVGSVRYRNLSQIVLNTPMGSVHYYDGMTLVQESGKWLVQDLKPFRAKVKDTEKVGAWDEAVKASGFKNLFPILYLNAEREHMPKSYWDEDRITDIISDPEKSEDWLAVVAKFKWDYNWNYKSHGQEWFTYTRAVTWTKLRSKLTKGMNKTIETTETCI